MRNPTQPALRWEAREHAKMSRCMIFCLYTSRFELEHCRAVRCIPNIAAENIRRLRADALATGSTKEEERQSGHHHHCSERQDRLTRLHLRWPASPPSALAALPYTST